MVFGSSIFRQCQIPAWFRPEKVQRFTAALREALTTGDGRFRRDYLRLFVDKIIVADNEIRIRGTTASIARAAAHGGLPRTDQLVPSLVREWRAREDSNSQPPDP
jgi:hypothetical protein